MILDSCFLIDVLSSDEGAIAKREEMLTGGVPIAIAAPSITEVERGLGATSTRQEFRSLVADVAVVPYDHQVARAGAAILQTLNDRGTPIGTLDAMVAAVARTRDEPVVTRNVSEFDRVDGLVVSPY